MPSEDTAGKVIDLVKAGDWLLKKYKYKSSRQWSQVVAVVSLLFEKRYTRQQDSRYIQGVVDVVSTVVRIQRPSFTLCGLRVQRLNASPIMGWSFFEAEHSEFLDLCSRSLVYSAMTYLDASAHQIHSGLRNILISQIETGFDGLVFNYVRSLKTYFFDEFRTEWKL